MMVAICPYEKTIMPRINYDQLLDIFDSMCESLEFLNLFPKIVSEISVVPEDQAALDTDHPDATIYITFKNPLYTSDFQRIFKAQSEMCLPFSSSGYMISLNLAVDTNHAICDPDKVHCAMNRFDYLMKCTELEQSLLDKNVELPADFNARWEGFRDQIKQAPTEVALLTIFQQVSNYYMQCKGVSAPCSHASIQSTLANTVVSNPITTAAPPLNTIQSFSIDTVNGVHN